MNTRDMQMMKDIIIQIGDISNENNILFSVNYLQISKTNLILLKGLLEGLKKKGILITIDRPHQYMEHLLRMHRIDYTNLLFIDTISRFSGSKLGTRNNGDNYNIQGSPFQIDLLPELFSPNPKNDNGGEGKLDLANVDFILVDNIATMLSYNDYDMVVVFLRNYLAKSNNTNKIFKAVILDKKTHGNLYREARRLCDREIIIDGMEGRKSGVIDERKERIPFLIKKISSTCTPLKNLFLEDV